MQRLLNGSMPAAPNFAFVIVDVRDVASLHVAAMTGDEAGGRRYPAGNGTYSLMELGNMLRSELPDHARKLPRFQAPNWLVRVLGAFDKDVRGNLGELGVVKRTDALDARALLGRPFISARDAAAATGRSLVAQHLV